MSSSSPGTPASIEQMNAIAAVRHLTRRADLIERARGGNPIRFALWLALLCLFALLSIGSFKNPSLLYGAVGVSGIAMVVVAIKELWIRLDAIVELLERDGQAERE